MKNFNLILIALSLTYSVSAQDVAPKSQFAKDFLPVWSTSVKIAIEVAEAMPEDLYQYQPTDSSKTFAGQIGHIAFTSLYLANTFALDKNSAYEDPDTSDMTKAQLVAYLKSQLEEATNAISMMTDEQANETVKAFGGKMVKRYIAVSFVQDHLANHRAKANLYIRMNGITPPAYGYF